MFHRTLNTTTDKQPQGPQAIRVLPAVLFRKSAVNNKGKPQGATVDLIFMTTISSLCAHSDHTEGVCRHAVCVGILLLCLCHRWARREAESSSSKLPAPTSSTQKSVNCQSSRLQQITEQGAHTLTVCVCVFIL